MSGSSMIRTAIFAAGALVGGGVATIISNRKQPVPSVTRPPVASTAPIIDVDESGKTRLADAGLASLNVVSTVLKYGNPG